MFNKTENLATYYFIPVHDSLQAVRNGYDCSIMPKLMPKGRLNGIISFVICSQVS